ncbi:CBS domain-containing protein [Ekhidna sp.]
MKTLVKELMTSKVHSIGISNSLIEARDMLLKYHIRHLPVMDDDKLVGILSRTDVMRLSFGDVYDEIETEADAALYNALTIEDVMVNRPRTVASTDPISIASRIFIEEEYHALPVLEDDKLAGIITTTDVIRNYQQEQHSAKIPKKYTEERPWGNFEQFCENRLCTVKLINVNPNEELSLQYHRNRNEFWRVVKGKGKVVIGKQELDANVDDEFSVPAKTKHRIITQEFSLQILEISYGLFDEKDIVRLIDKYHRTQQ